jgi:hypothetical protein
MNQAKPLTVHQAPFPVREDVERVISALTELRYELEDGDTGLEFMPVDQRKLIAQVNRDLRVYIAIARRRRRL